MHYESCEQIAHIVDEIEGLLVIGQERFLFDMVRGLPEDAVIVEIGSYLGKSTVCMGLACKGTGRRIYAIDTWDGNDKDFDERNFISSGPEISLSTIWNHMFSPYRENRQM